MKKFNEESAINMLKSISHSPYDPEPPKKRLIVDIIVYLYQKIGGKPLVTPHLYGGANIDKTKYEYSTTERFLNSVQQFFSLSDFDGKDILDVGCGWGGKSIFFAEHSNLRSLTGFDLPGVFVPDDAMAFAIQKNVQNCFFKVGHAESMPVDDEAFDFIIMEDVLEHVKDPARVINECMRVLKPGGKTFIKFPSFKMIMAHHLDSALLLPAAHYLLNMRTWAQGLNYRRYQGLNDALYEPFPRVIRTQFSKCIGEAMNGIDFSGFKQIIKQTEFEIKELKLIPFQMFSKKPYQKKLYRALYRICNLIPVLKEFFSYSIIFIGIKPLRSV